MKRVLFVAIFALVSISADTFARDARPTCFAHDGLPDPVCTPGAVFKEVTADDVCRHGYTAEVRHVTDATRRKVFALYGVISHPRGVYEVDHHIPLELGGSNAIANLWPEPAEPLPGFHQKDRVENYLHREVCAGRMRLEEAQRRIAKDWRAIYRQIYGE